MEIFVYLLIRDDQDVPFYVGIGNIHRVRQRQRMISNNESYTFKHYCLELKAAGINYKTYVVDKFYNRFDAYKREQELIAEFGRQIHGGGILINQSIGGLDGSRSGSGSFVDGFDLIADRMTDRASINEAFAAYWARV